MASHWMARRGIFAGARATRKLLLEPAGGYNIREAIAAGKRVGESGSKPAAAENPTTRSICAIDRKRTVAGAPGASRSWLAPPPLEGQQREACHTADGHAQDADQLRGGQLHKQCVFHDTAGRPSRPTSATDPTGARWSRREPLLGTLETTGRVAIAGGVTAANLPHRLRNARRS